MSIKRKEKNTKKSVSSSPSESFVEKLKRRPGFILATIIFIILILFLIFSQKTTISDATLMGGYARSFHENNQGMIDYYLEGINGQIVGQYDDTTEDDYLYSMQSDYTWLKNKDNQIFSSKPSTDVLVKEMAMSYFLEEISVLNQDFLFDFSSATQGETIELAKSIQITDKNSFSSEVSDIFSGEPSKQDLFVKTYNELRTEYLITKKDLINSTAGDERRFVEAKKVILLTSSD